MDPPLTCNPLSTYVQPPKDIPNSMPQSWKPTAWPATIPTWQDEPRWQPPISYVNARDAIDPAWLPPPPPTTNWPPIMSVPPAPASTPVHNYAAVPSSEAYPAHSSVSPEIHDARLCPVVPGVMSVREVLGLAIGQRALQNPAPALSAPYAPRPSPITKVTTFEVPFVCKILDIECSCAGVIEPTFGDIRYHFKYVHKLRGPMKCPWPVEVCPEKDLLEEHALYRHVLRKHGHCYMHRCLQCGQELPAGTGLREAERHAAHCQNIHQCVCSESCCRL